MPLLDAIHTPADLKKLPPAELADLAKEMRARIFDAVSRNGGHLASNLGVVELTIALHYVYDFGPYPTGPDRLLFDVGHQCYPHKMLTGRAGGFEHLRKKGSVSGFPSPEESPYDLFAVGHAGTAISTAVGMARGDGHLGRHNHVVAVVGDASVVNGLAFEGLNNAGTLKRQMLIILNDNGMSISKPQGAFAQYLDRVRVSATYEEMKRLGKKIVHELPSPVGHAIEGAWHSLRDSVKSAKIPTGQVFESLGIKYLGPIDGHDLPGLLNTLAEIKHVDHPVLLHVKTVKGQGYEIAASEPTKFHSPAAFNVRMEQQGCRVELTKGSGKAWTSAYAEAMIALAKTDPRVMALTAAMPDGTGIDKVLERFPERAFDVGIAEQHCVTFAAGLSTEGFKPVCAIYSTFLQRAFDQIAHDVCLQTLNVKFCMDRAGIVGGDGPTHHGLLDIAYLRGIPHMTLMAPKDEGEMRDMLHTMLETEGPMAMRYPRGSGSGADIARAPELLEIGKAELLREGGEVAVVAYGSMVHPAVAAAEQLARDGIEATVVNARFVKPLDAGLILALARTKRLIVTVEEAYLAGGFGSAVMELLEENNLLGTCRVIRMGVPDRIITHGDPKLLLAKYGLDADGIYTRVKEHVAQSDRAGLPFPSARLSSKT